MSLPFIVAIHRSRVIISSGMDATKIEKIDSNTQANTVAHRPLILTKEKIRAERLRELLNKRVRLIFRRCVFIDLVDLVALMLPEALAFERCTFRQPFDARSARFERSLVFTGCHFKKSINLESAHVKGSLELSFSRIDYPPDGDKPDEIIRPAYEPPPPYRSAKFGGITIDGHFKCQCLRVKGSLDLGHARIHGGAFFEGAQIGLGPFGGRFYIRQARIDGDFELMPWVDPYWHKAKGKMKILRTQILGVLSIGASHFKGRVNLRGIYIFTDFCMV